MLRAGQASRHCSRKIVGNQSSERVREWGDWAAQGSLTSTGRAELSPALDQSLPPLLPLTLHKNVLGPTTSEIMI